MIMDFIYKNRHFLRSQNKLIKFILLATALFTLNIKPNKNSLSSDDLLYENLKHYCKPKYMKFQDEKHLVKSPANTILIVCDPLQQEMLNLVYGTVKHMDVKYKEIIFTYDRNHTSKYFTVINFRFDKESFTAIRPLQNYQPNSDLAYIANFYFPSRYFYSFYDLLNIPNKNFGFTININLKYSNENIKKFCTFLRTLVNIQSFSNGAYFYIPIGNSNLEIVQFLPFSIIIFAYYLLDWVFLYNSGSTIYTICNLILFYFLPITGWSVLIFKRELPFLLFTYYIINFRYGILIMLTCFIKEVYNLLVINDL